MTSNRRRFLLALFLLLPVVLSAQHSSVLWLKMQDAEPIASDFERLVLQNQDAGGIRLEFRDIDPARVLNELNALRSQSAAGPVALQCSLQEYERMLKDPAARALLEDLHLAPINPRLFGYPFYILGTGKPADAGGEVDLAWITLAGGHLRALEDADLLTMLSESLGRPKTSLKVVRERGAYPAARKLYEGAYNLVGVYDDEPSTLLDEFEVNWSQELKAGSLQFLRFEKARAGNRMVPVAPGRFGYMFFSYRGEPFPGVPDSEFILAVTHQIKHDFPLVLSNADLFSRGDSLNQVLGTAYFLMPSIGPVLEEDAGTRLGVQHVYLLNSYLADPASRIRGLALLGSLLMKQEAGGTGARREIFRDKSRLLQQKLRLPGTSVDQILEWMNLRPPAAGRRESFSSDVSRLYEDAVRMIDEAQGRSGQERRSLLEKAGSNLVAALRIGERPRNVQGSRGLWSVSDYNPYYQLARVAFYLEQEDRRRP